jgi:hypothetical protein
MIIPGLARLELSVHSRRKINFPGHDTPGPGSPACPREFPGPGHTPVRGG